MPSAVLPTISADEIDDFLFLARTNDIHDLKAGIEAIARTRQTSSENVILATIDPDNGNGLLHYASANGCLEILQHLLPSPPSYTPSPPNINLPNTSGNTPLHWAALNGHLDAVKILVCAGADPAIRNIAGHDAVYEAERSGKQEVVEWLLKEGNGLERGVEGAKQDEEKDEEGYEETFEPDNEGSRDKEKGKGVEQVLNRLGNIKMEEKNRD
ncbi:MAG: hypothetical protein L6R42_008482 [Xanthoria sp. 1 TBL-2021]|nr:MAG: hypothetical protein L6R42_008482 [Xanthoria sp. 1 TBL-2021]